MVRLEETDPIDVPSEFKPTYCAKHGSGICLCTSDGMALDTMRRKSTGVLRALCPAKTKARRLLLQGFVFVRFQMPPTGEMWLHVSLM